MIRVDWQNIESYSDVPPAFRLIDRAEVEEGRAAYGWKAVSSLDWYFSVHFPGNPVMPGVFVMEMMRQTAFCAVAFHDEPTTGNCHIVSCPHMRMFREIRPGDVLRTHVSVDFVSAGHISCVGTTEVVDVDDGSSKKVCTMHFSLGRPRENMASAVLKQPSGQSMDGMVISFAEMDRYIADPPGYRFVDTVQVVPGVRAQGRLTLHAADWFVRSNVSRNGDMPVAFLMESIMQTGVFSVTTIPGNDFRLMMFHSCKQFDLYRQTQADTVVHTEARLRSYRNGVAVLSGAAYTKKGCICAMEFVLVAPEDMTAVRR